MLQRLARRHGRMVRSLVAACLFASAFGQAWAQGTKALFLFGGQGHKTFLGCLNCGESHPKSVWNEFSQFGFKNDFGVWSPFGEFAGAFSTYSMCNQFAPDPPIIVDEEGGAYGRMSLNEFAPRSVCGHGGNERMCRAVRAICAAKS